MTEATGLTAVQVAARALLKELSGFSMEEPGGKMIDRTRFPAALTLARLLEAEDPDFARELATLGSVMPHTGAELQRATKLCDSLACNWRLSAAIMAAKDAYVIGLRFIPVPGQGWDQDGLGR